MLSKRPAAASRLLVATGALDLRLAPPGAAFGALILVGRAAERAARAVAAADHAALARAEVLAEAAAPILIGSRAERRADGALILHLATRAGADAPPRLIAPPAPDARRLRGPAEARLLLIPVFHPAARRAWARIRPLAVRMTSPAPQAALTGELHEHA